MTSHEVPRSERCPLMWCGSQCLLRYEHVEPHDYPRFNGPDRSSVGFTPARYGTPAEWDALRAEYVSGDLS